MKACTHCRKPLTAERARFEVHDPVGVSGTFCTAQCYEDERMGKPLVPVRQGHGDADTLMPSEGIVRHAPA